MAAAPRPGERIEDFLERYRKQDLLRFVAVGSVDDGKSTLIGRLLYETGSVFDDQLEAVRRASQGRGAGPIDFSLLTDGLVAEREQGITIDVAYRYFATERRKFILADTPGHVQYTRNMVTGASTADVAIVLVDARLGVLPQSRRHATICSMLGIEHLLVAVNKMDLVGYDRQVYERICAQFSEVAERLRFESVTFVPTSALQGDNVVGPSRHTPWYDGPSVLSFLETVRVERDVESEPMRLPVQMVLRPHLDYRGYAGRLASGIVRPGDEVVVLPSGQRSRVAGIDGWEGELPEAFAPQSVVVRLADELDVSRGDMIVAAEAPPLVQRRFEADIVWMDERPLDPRKTYLLKHTTQWVRAQVEHVEHKLDMDTLQPVAAERLEMNDVGRVRLLCHRALYFEPYERNRALGAFVLVDSLTHRTAAGGMIRPLGAERPSFEELLREARAGSALRPGTQVSPAERRERMGQVGAAVWLTGLPGSGRWLLAFALERRLFDLGKTVTVLDPRGEDLRSIVSAAKACTEAGLVTICAFPSYLRSERARVRERLGEHRLLEVYVNTDPALCRERRPEAQPERFEPPEHPDVTVALDHVRLDQAVETLVRALARLDRRAAGEPSVEQELPG